MVRVGRLAEPARGVRAGGRVGGAGVAVGVVAERTAAERGLDLGLGGVAPEPQRLVVVAHRPPGAQGDRVRSVDRGRKAGGRPRGDERDRRRRRRGRSACRASSGPDPALCRITGLDLGEEGLRLWSWADYFDSSFINGKTISFFRKK